MIEKLDNGNFYKISEEDLKRLIRICVTEGIGISCEEGLEQFKGTKKNPEKISVNKTHKKAHELSKDLIRKFLN